MSLASESLLVCFWVLIRVSGGVIHLIKVGIGFWNNAMPFKIFPLSSYAFSPPCRKINESTLEFFLRNWLESVAHSSLDSGEISVMNSSQFRFEEGEQKVVCRGQIRTVQWVGNHVLIHQKSKSSVGGMGAGVVMLQNLFSVCVSIHSSCPHARPLFADPLTQAPQSFNIGITVNALFWKLN